ncbi:MAG: hypothetical protein WCL28_07970 [bacterium]
MIIKNSLVTLLVVASLSGCGATDDSGNSAGPVSDADGNWSSTCVDLSVPGIVTSSTKSSYAVASGQAITTFGIYSDAACTTVASLYVSTSTFTTGNAVTAPAGAKEFSGKATSMTITLNTDEAVADANDGEDKICSGGFVKGQAKTFTAADCPNDKSFNDSYNIYKVDGTKLFIGECGDSGTATDCSAPAKRPTTLPEAFCTKA